MSIGEIVVVAPDGTMICDVFGNTLGLMPSGKSLSTETEWRAVGTFDTSNTRYNPNAILSDADGTAVSDADATGIGGTVKITIARDDVSGPKSFDALASQELVEVNYALLTTIIADGASLSSAVTLNNRPLLSITVPSGWDDANMTFQVSFDGITYYELVDEDGAAVTLIAAASKIVRTTNLDQWAGYEYLKIRSGTFDTPVTQSGAVTLSLKVRDA